MCGSSSTTVKNEPPIQTDAQMEADRLRLEEMRRQNDLLAQLAPGQQAAIDMQNQLLQYQLDNLPQMEEYQKQQIALAQAQLQNAISDEAMRSELMPHQLQLLRSQNELALEQVDSLKQTTAFQTEANKYTLDALRDQSARLAARNEAYSPQEEAAAAAEEARRATRLSAISEEASNIQLENLKRGNKPTDEQLSAINESIDAAQAFGESDISRYLKESLRTINEEVAQAAGLRSTDAPALRLSERAGEEAGRAQGDLTSKLAETRATARLNYPLAANKLEGDLASSLSATASNASQFQQQLRLAAAQNRTAAFSLPSSVGFAMPQGASSGGGGGGGSSLGFAMPGTGGGVPGLNQNVLTGSIGPQVQGNSSSSGTAATNYGQIAQGVGSLIAAYAALAASDARLKTDIKRVGKTDAGLPVYTFRYKSDPEMLRIGVMAQHVHRLFPNAVVKHPSGYLMVKHSEIA